MRPTIHPRAAGASVAAQRKVAFTSSPKFIFLSWTGLVFFAGFGYYTVKTRNTAKAQVFLRQARDQALSESESKDLNEAEIAQLSRRQADRKASAAAKSPVQSLAAAFSRQKE